MATVSVRKRFRVRGVVQGVGFRPHTYQLAEKWGLSGFVLNDSEGVVIEVEGPLAAVDGFWTALRSDPPVLATIDSFEETSLEPVGGSAFQIRFSEPTTGQRTPIGADIATCDACLAEMANPSERRFRYPFTNCTDCGPRFTITSELPYDRPNTTMVTFEMCDLCRAEYDDPTDRRFHAQPIACPACGPHLRLLDPAGNAIEGDAIKTVAQLLQAGKIVAIKGVGGFHLACDALNEDAITILRNRKMREEKPLAVMARSLEEARRLIRPDAAEATVMASPRRPVVLVARLEGFELPEAVAPGNRFLGVMLPYTPLHHLLMSEFEGPIVLTSGNLTDEPIAYTNDDAVNRLGKIADAFLLHDRDIYMRCDDSVVRVVDDGVYPIRRSRGYAPEPIAAPRMFKRTVLGVGGELKHTFCLGIGGRAFLSHHIGDLENLEAMQSFEHSLEHFVKIFDAEPEVVAHDLHPEYLSTKWALDRTIESIGIQHHHAHIASCLADNGRDERVIGLALDGTGYGDDGTLWGFEVLVCDLTSYERVATLKQVPLPGGGAAIKEPWRMAAVYLHEAFGDGASTLEIDFVGRTAAAWAPILQMARAGINSPLASSAGRLFDAVAALCGLRDRVSYEGQAAAELEQRADPASAYSYGSFFDGSLIDGAALVGVIAEDLASGKSVPEVAAGFHNSLVETLVAACVETREATGLATVALSGGSFQNVLLLTRCRAGLSEAGFEVLIHHQVPANDGGLSLGQAMIANTRL